MSKWLVLLYLLFCSVAFAQDSPPVWSVANNTTTVWMPWQTKFPGQNVADNGDGTASISIDPASINGSFLRKDIDDSTDYNITVNNLYLGKDADTYFILSGNTLSLYVQGGLAQTWTFTPSAPTAILITFDTLPVQFDGLNILF